MIDFSLSHSADGSIQPPVADDAAHLRDHTVSETTIEIPDNLPALEDDVSAPLSDVIATGVASSIVVSTSSPLDLDTIFPRELVADEVSPNSLAADAHSTVAVEHLEKGERGNEEAPPPLPPFPSSAGADRCAPSTDDSAPAETSCTGEATADEGQLEEAPSEVFIPAPRINPVLSALRASGLYRGQPALGVHELTCPWVGQHVDGDDRPAIYIEPDDAYRQGRFSCPCGHTGQPRIHHLLEALDIDPDSATGKPIIRLVPGEMGAIAEAADRVLAGIGDYYLSGNMIVRVKHDPETGDLRTEPLNEQSLAKALSTGAIWTKWDSQKKLFVRTDPPPRYVTMLYRGQDFRHLPILKGLARQPYLQPDGRVVTKTGYDAASRMVGAFSPDGFPLPEPTIAAAKASLEALRALLSEFHFRAEHDRSAAICAMLTAAMRSQLPLAPAFNLSASASGSGKSYLATLIALFAGPAPAMNLSYPVRAEEAGKAVMTMLMSQPAVVLFDDMQTDWKPHGIINRMLTSETVSDRLLGGNNSATLSTATLFMGTGNNVSPEKDLRRRVISAYLLPKANSPATLSYSGRPVDVVRANRGLYVAHALTIVRAWIAAGKPLADVAEIASFEAWSNFCRQPLLMLGEPDPATSLIEQVQADPELEALTTLLREWHQEFGLQSATVRTIIGRAELDTDSDLYQAMLDLPFMDAKGVNRHRFGHFLKKNVNRFAGGLHIVRVENSERNAWAVVPVGKESSGYEPNVHVKAKLPYGLQSMRPVGRPAPRVDTNEIF